MTSTKCIPDTFEYLSLAKTFREVAIGIPDLMARKQILEVMCKGVKLQDSIDYGMLATLTPGTLLHQF